MIKIKWSLLVLGAISFNSFSSSCVSQGKWTSRLAAEQKQVINQIKNLERKYNQCEGLSSRINLDNLKLQPNLEAADETEDIKNLKNLSASSEQSEAIEGKIADAIVDKTLSVGGKLSSPHIKAGQAVIKTTYQAVDQFFSILDSDEYEECFKQAGFPIESLINSSIKTISAMNESSMVSADKQTNLISKVIKVLRNSKFKDAYQLNVTIESWNEISCLIETTAQTYCELQDSLDMLKSINPYNRKYKSSVDFNEEANSSSVVDGYFIKARDLGNIADWLVKVTYGAPSINMSDAGRKGTVLDNSFSYLKNSFMVQGAISQKRQVIDSMFRGVINDQGKKTKILELIRALRDILVSSTTEENFVTAQYDRDLIPFILLGFNKTPVVVSGAISEQDKAHITNSGDWTDPTCPRVKYNQTAFKRISWDDYLRQDGQTFHCALDNPDLVIENLKTNLDVILNGARKKAERYIQDFLIVDEVNLFASAMSGVGVSVYDSIINVENYLLGLKKRLELSLKESKSNRRLRNELRTMISTVDDVLPRLSRIFGAFDAVADKDTSDINMDTLDKELLTTMSSTINLDKEALRKQLTLKALAEKAINTVYSEFNMIFQQSNFLTMRLDTLISYDMRMLSRGNDISKDLKSLLVTSDGALYTIMSNSFNDSMTSSMAAKSADIYNAISIGDANLSFIESSMSNYLLATIRTLNSFMDGTYGNYRRGIDGVMKNIYENSDIAIIENKLKNKIYKDEIERRELYARLHKIKQIQLDADKGILNKLKSFGDGVIHGAKGAYRTFVQDSRQYPRLWVLGGGVTMNQYSDVKSYERLKDKLCLQSLMFTDAKRHLFDDVCLNQKQNIVMSNVFVDSLIQGDALGSENSISLKSAYDDRLFLDYDHVRNLPQKNRVCAFRDYFRNNKAMEIIYSPGK